MTTTKKENGYTMESKDPPPAYTNNGYIDDHIYDEPSSSSKGSTSLYHRVHVEKPQMDQIQFDDFYHAANRPSSSLKDAFSNFKQDFVCSGRCMGKTLLGFLPFLKIMKEYNKEWLFADIIAGLTIGIIQIPQGLAYSLLAELDPVVGLYVSFFPPLFYYFVGTSRHVSLGTFAVVSLMVGTTVEKFDCAIPCAEGTTETSFFEASTEGLNATAGPCIDEDAEKMCRMGIATATTMIAGLTQLIMGLVKLGFVVKYLSVPLTRGFTTGCAMHVFTSQVKYIVGISTDRYSGPLKLVYTYRDIFQDITSIKWSAVVLSFVCIIILWITKEYLNPPVKKRIKAPIPIDLIIVIFGTVVSWAWDFNEKYDMPIVGEIPTGIPPPMFPPVDRFGSVLVDGIIIAVVAFAISVSMVQLYASKYSYESDPNQELVAHGLCNAISSNFNCYVMCVSLSRSAVNESIGVKTQVYALVSCVLILLVIYFIAPLFETLPNCVLAAIIVVALKGLFLQFKDIPKYWRISGTECSVWLVTFIAVVILDVGYGLVVGVIYGLLTVVGRTQKPYTCLLGRIPNTADYKDKEVYQIAEEIDGVKVYRFECSIYYANKDHFIESLYQLSGCDPKRLKLNIAKCKNKRAKFIKDGGSEADAEREFPEPVADIHHVVIDCSSVGYCDAMGVTVLRQVTVDYNEIGVEVFYSGLCEGVRSMFEEGGFYEKCSSEQLFPTVHDAVISTLEEYPDMQAKLLHNVVDASYRSADSPRDEKKGVVEEMQVEMPSDLPPKNRTLSHLRARSDTNRSRANTQDGYHNPALVVDDIMDLNELDNEADAEETFVTDL